jgi:heme exporter protein B
MRYFLSKIYAVLYKEIYSELRSRYAFSSMILFIVITISTISFTMAGDTISNELASALLWIVIFFGAMTGLSRTFVAEEERGTSLLLKLSSKPIHIYVGKLLYTFIFGLLLNSLAVILFQVFLSGIIVKNQLLFWTMILISSLGISACITAIAAIISKAHSKGSLFPVLSFPLLLPLTLLGCETISMALYGARFEDAFSNIIVLISYSIVMITVSIMVFEFIWND